jgi:hypothetical protein
MGKIYSMKAATADDDLSFKLKRSIQLVKERQMGKIQGGKKKESKERASVSRERRLALALRAVLEEQQTQDANEGLSEVGYAADAVLTELGYGDIVGIPTRVAALNEQLTAAMAAGDGATIAALGAELVRAKAGLPPKVVTEKAKAAGE